MRALVSPCRFKADIRVPASKSHTIRRLLFGSLADGPSRLEEPLDSMDSRACLAACQAFGVKITENIYQEKLSWTVHGLGIGVRAGGSDYVSLPVPDDIIDIANSGTSLYLTLAIAALSQGWTVLTGDSQIRRRRASQLIKALKQLGAEVFSTRGDDCAPLVIRGPFSGGRVSLECPTSQYLSALLIACPLAPAGTMTIIDVPLLNERPYVAMTLAYLNQQHIAYRTAPDWSYFELPGGARYRPLSGPLPGDFSSAAFPACAAVVSSGQVVIRGLDPADSQGDKAVFSMLEALGCQVLWQTEGDETILTVSRSGRLRPAVLDLNATPDALPVLAVIACFADGESRLVNVANARIKETDRITVMAKELRKLGAQVTEEADGLRIQGQGGLRGGVVESHGDHRVAMALAAAALGADGPITIEDADCAAVTYPGFWELLAAQQS